jgi:chemotaxis protein histidine kinase CheA
LLSGRAQDALTPDPRWLIVATGERACCLEVDRLHAIEEIVISELGAVLSKIPAFAGAAFMGSGDIALVLSVPWLVEAVAAANTDERRSAFPLRTPA